MLNQFMTKYLVFCCESKKLKHFTKYVYIKFFEHNIKKNPKIILKQYQQGS